MNVFFKIVVGLLVLLPVLLAGLLILGRGEFLLTAAGLMLGAPDDPFSTSRTVAAPDYSNDIYWAALPGSTDLADLTPEGVADFGLAEKLLVDVFFIHPTGLMNGSSWVSGLQVTSKTEENTMWMMANQASIFNGCCQVYAPRYRQASIFTYLTAGGVAHRKIMRFAYNDVLAAFEHFLDHRSQGRPFIIASHSQGSQHGATLLRERIDGTPLVDRMVAAYLVGGNLAITELEMLADIGICDSPTQLHCVIHYDTMSERAAVQRERADNLCVNPLNWRLDGQLAPRSEHEGAVIPSGKFQVDFFSDRFTGIEFAPLAAPLPNYVSARCDDGVLYVTDLAKTEFDGIVPSGHNYHILDYPLFHMNIRSNAILRTNVYLQALSQ